MIVLDTHIWLWWVNGDRTSLKASWLEAIETADVVGVSAISCFEIAWLAHNRRIELPSDSAEWFSSALSGSGIELLFPSRRPSPPSLFGWLPTTGIRKTDSLSERHSSTRPSSFRPTASCRCTQS